MATDRLFGVWDYVVFALTLGISAVIGVYYGCSGGKQRTTSEFLMANRNLSVLPVAISILLSYMSAILVLGTPAEMYISGTQFYVNVFGVFFGVGLAAYVFVPLLYPLKLTSSFEYLERRFRSKYPKLTGTVILIVQQIMYMGMASFAPSTALETVTGFPVWATIIIVGIVSSFYTTLGGMKAVIWTDVFQGGVMFAGILAIIVKGVISVGGFSKMWKTNDEWGRIQFFDFSVDPTQRHSFWSLTIGAMLGWCGTYGCNQASVQRYSALSSISSAKRCVLLNSVGVTLMLTGACLCGVVLFAYYTLQGCDPLTSNKVKNPNQLMPYFVMEILNFPGLPGLFVSCLFSGSLSTMSSCLNALAAVTWEDFLKPYYGKRLSESQKTWITKLLVLVFGAAGTGMAFLAKGVGGTVLQASLSFTSTAAGPLMGMFLLGGVFPWANSFGAVIGGVVGLILPLWISIGAHTLPPTPFPLPFPTSGCVTGNVTLDALVTEVTSLLPYSLANSTAITPPIAGVTGIRKLYTVSYLWYSPIGTATTVIIGLAISFLTGPMRVGDVDPRYLIPLFDRLFCCLPASWLKVFRCNKEFPDPKSLREEEHDIVLELLPPEKLCVTSQNSQCVQGRKELILA